MLSLLPQHSSLLPFFGALAAFALARAPRRARRRRPGPAVRPSRPPRNTRATAFTKPLRRIFSYVLIPDRQRTVEGGISPWFPSAILYRTESRDLADEAARTFAAVTLRAARRTRIVAEREPPALSRLRRPRAVRRRRGGRAMIVVLQVASDRAARAARARRDEAAARAAARPARAIAVAALPRSGEALGERSAAPRGRVADLGRGARASSSASR